jgi:hypothetical protein
VTDPALDRRIDACQSSIEDTAENRNLLRAARRVLAGRKPARAGDLHASPELPVGSENRFEAAAHAAGDDHRRSAVSRTGERLRRVNSLAGDLFSRFRSQLQNAFGALAAIVVGRTHKPMVRLALLLFIAAGLIGLGVNTALHLSATRTEGPGLEQEAAKRAGRFTIQVAAFRDRSQAERYVHRLADQNLDAYWIPAQDGDRFWYQVRVSRFESPEEARTFGKALKKNAIINDYYVANYR